MKLPVSFNHSCLLESALAPLARMLLCGGIALLTAGAAHAADSTDTPIQTASSGTELSGTELSAANNGTNVSMPLVLGTTNSVAISDAQLLKGWDFTFSRLVSKGFKAEELLPVFLDSRMPTRDNFLFSLKPKESRNPYRKININRSAKYALECYQEHSEHFKAASAQYHVPTSVILAILQVETQCGKHQGRQPVFHKLVRLASASTPESVELNSADKVSPKTKVTRADVQARADWLENTFLPHAAAAVRLARKEFVSPHDLLGSSAGAMGVPQFLPGNIFEYGLDGNKDGVVDIHGVEDSIYSVANYLHANGWTKPQLERKKARAVITTYNNSAPYIDTVLNISKAIDKFLSTLNRPEPRISPKGLKKLTL